MNYKIKKCDLDVSDPFHDWKMTRWNVCRVQHQCSLRHIFKSKDKSIQSSWHRVNLSFFIWILCIRAVKIKWVRDFCITSSNLTVLLWPPSSAQWAALFVVFRPLNYSGFVFKPIIHLNNQSCNLLMCIHYTVLWSFYDYFFLFS